MFNMQLLLMFNTQLLLTFICFSQQVSMQLLLMFWYLLQSTNQHATTAGVLVFALVSMQLLLMFIFLQSASQHATAGV